MKYSIESPRFSRRKRVAQDKRAEILDVAARFFLSHGYAGSSVSAMARHSGISKESFYRYFKSKEDLFTAVAELELEEYRSKLEQLSEHWDKEDLRESLVKFASTLLSVLLADRTLALRRLVFNETRRVPEIGRLYFNMGPSLAYHSLERCFALHREETRFKPRLLSRSFMALVLHELMLERNCGLREKPTAAEIAGLTPPIVDHFIEAYFTLPANHRLASPRRAAASRR